MQLSYGSKQRKQHTVNSRQQKSESHSDQLTKRHRPAVCRLLSAVCFTIGI